MSAQYDVKHSPRGIKHPPRTGVILGSDVHGATAKDMKNLPAAEKFFQSLGEGQFVSLSDAQRTVNGQPHSISGNVVRKDSVKDVDLWHHTIYVK
jgi:hypothetical protein